MRGRGTPFFLALLLFAGLPGAYASFPDRQPVSTFQLSGVVVDATGAAIAGAAISAGSLAVESDARGRFTLIVPAGEVTLRVRAAGFADFVGPGRAGQIVRVILHPAGVAETVTITAGRSVERLADTASPTSVITAPVLLTSATMTVDDALRSVPGFSLFRRSSSRVANPTTQGVSLRGLAASGASRALVLADGVPLNDPYGGWVYWDRIPQASIDRVEAVRGGGAESLYGSRAVAGTVQIVTIQPRGTTARASFEAGAHGHVRASLFGGTRAGRWSGFAAAERFVLDGFPIVAADERGPVDVNAGVRYWSGLADATRSTDRWSLGVRVNWLDEDRANGTPLQRNDTNLRSIALQGRVASAAGVLSVAGFGGTVDYDQSFSSVAPGRISETLTARQRVPSDHAGASAQWSSAWRGRPLLFGADVQRVSGGSGPVSEGVQHDGAAYSQIRLQPLPRTTLLAGARAGVWSSTPADASGSAQRLVYVFPRVSLTWVAHPAASMMVTWNSPGREPTLNELYRDFQVGNVLTMANPHLRPESAHAFEVGSLLTRGRAAVRLVAFWTELADAIANVTLGSTEGRLFRRRENAGHIRARGVEAEGDWRLNAWASVLGSVAWLDSTFTRSDEPALAGRRVSQVPRWQGSLSLRLTPGRAVATLDWRATGAQFDDDRNQFRLAGASVLDVYVGASLRPGIQPFVAAENLFNAEVDVGRTPVRTTGTPRSVRAGVRVFVP